MGMYTECQEELIRALKAAGCEREPFLSLKRMANSAERRISGVLCEDEQVDPRKGKRFFKADVYKRQTCAGRSCFPVTSLIQ